MKAQTQPRGKTPSVSAAHLAAAIVAVKAMDVRQKEQVCDRIHAEQPNLLASVLALPRLGVSMQTVDVVLNMLIVLTLAIDNSGQSLATVTEVDQERGDGAPGVGDQNSRETSLTSARVINTARSAMPMRCPTSKARSDRGRPRTISAR